MRFFQPDSTESGRRTVAQPLTEAGTPPPQTVEQGNPKTFTVPGLKSGQAYVITLEDSKGKLFAGPIMTDHTGASLKTLPSISRAHVSIRSVTVKLKEVMLGLQIPDTAKLTG